MNCTAPNIPWELERTCERIVEFTYEICRMYEASGGSHDWAKGSLKVPYAYLIELRPKNSATGYGFLLPEREIPATGLETFEAIKVVADEMVGQFVQPMIREIAGLTLRRIIGTSIFRTNEGARNTA